MHLNPDEQWLLIFVAFIWLLVLADHVEEHSRRRKRARLWEQRKRSAETQINKLMYDGDE